MDIECAGFVMGAAADLIEKLTDRCARYAEEIAVLQARQKWIPCGGAAAGSVAQRRNCRACELLDL